MDSKWLKQIRGKYWKKQENEDQAKVQYKTLERIEYQTRIGQSDILVQWYMYQTI